MTMQQQGTFMTVRELMEILETYPQDVRVVVSGYEDGYDDLSPRQISEEQNANYRQGNAALSDLDREGVAESVTRRFKICYDCLWKVLRRYLTHELGIAATPNSPKPVFRLAHENDLFTAPIEQWFRYAEARIDTSHDYDGEKTKTCLVLVPDFIDDRDPPLSDRQRYTVGVDAAIDITAAV